MKPNLTYQDLDYSRHGKLYWCVFLINSVVIHDSEPLPTMEGVRGYT